MFFMPSIEVKGFVPWMYQEFERKRVPASEVGRRGRQFEIRLIDVLVESVGPIDPDALGGAVSHAMARATKVEVHNEQTMVVKIQEE